MFGNVTCIAVWFCLNMLMSVTEAVDLEDLASWCMFTYCVKCDFRNSGGTVLHTYITEIMLMSWLYI